MLNVNLSQRNLIILCTLLTAWVALTFFYASWQWHSDWLLAHQATTQTKPVVKIEETASLLSALPNEHLFGKSLTNDVPVTNLQFRVTGIVKAENEISKAYISIGGQASKIYRQGDDLPYGVKIYAITNNAIILENDGHLEKLPLPRAQLHFKPRETGEG